MYVWGDIKNAILAKLDMDENEADNLSFLTRFPIYANEVITQICSTIKPKRTFYEFEVNHTNVNTPIKMPDDFISFGDDINQISEDVGFGTILTREAFSEDFRYHGYNEIICNHLGKYSISYNARWLIFREPDDDLVLDAPMDVLECIPPYVASQCMKIDDEHKSAVFRNEFEIMFARIDDTDYKYNKTFTIGGDW